MKNKGRKEEDRERQKEGEMDGNGVKEREWREGGREEKEGSLHRPQFGTCVKYTSLRLLNTSLLLLRSSDAF